MNQADSALFSLSKAKRHDLDYDRIISTFSEWLIFDGLFVMFPEEPDGCYEGEVVGNAGHDKRDHKVDRGLLAKLSGQVPRD